MQDRLGDNANRRGWRGGEDNRKVVAGVNGGRLITRLPGSMGRDWWKDNALRKYPANQAPLGHGMTTSHPVKPLAPSFNKLPPLADVNNAPFSKKVEDAKLRNNLAFQKPPEISVVGDTASKRNDIGDGRQRSTSSFGDVRRLTTLAPAQTGRDVRGRGWTEQQKAAVLQQTRGTDRAPGGKQTQGQSRDGIQRPTNQRIGEDKNSKNRRTEKAPDASQKQGRLRDGEQRPVNQRIDSTDRKPGTRGMDEAPEGQSRGQYREGERRVDSAATNRDPRTLGGDTAPAGQSRGQYRDGIQRPTNRQIGATATSGNPRTRGTDRAPGGQLQGQTGDRKQIAGSPGTNPGSGIKRGDREHQKEGRQPIGINGRAGLRDVRKQERMADRMGDNAGQAGNEKNVGNKHPRGDVRGENGSKKRTDAADMVVQKRKPDDQFAKRTSDVDSNRKTVDKARDRKEDRQIKWPKVHN